MEIVLKGVFEVYWPTQSGPDVQIITRFKNAWEKNDIDKSKWKPGIKDAVIATIFADKAVELLASMEGYLQV